MSEQVLRREPIWLSPIKSLMWAGLGALICYLAVPAKKIEVEGPVLIRDKIVVERVEIPTLVPVPVIVEKTTVIEKHHHHYILERAQVTAKGKPVAKTKRPCPPLYQDPNDWQSRQY